MDPSLVYLDSHDGRLLAQVRPDDHFASIRHLALGANDAIAVAMQYEGPETNPYPVVGFHRGDERIQTIAAPRETLVRMRRYSASVCVAPSGVAAVTCPRGDLVTFFEVASGALLRTMDIRDAGGVTTTAGGREFLITTGLGEIHHIDARTLEPLRDPQRVAAHWDNHALGTLAL